MTVNSSKRKAIIPSLRLIIYRIFSNACKTLPASDLRLRARSLRYTIFIIDYKCISEYSRRLRMHLYQLTEKSKISHEKQSIYGQKW